jgi:uncharacterized protein YdeI (BOF family)
MKVKIIKSSGDRYWYRDKIGEIYEVDIWDEDNYVVIKSAKDDDCNNYIIDKEDCELYEKM